MPNLLNIATKQHVLISFNALYDIDIGLIELVRERYSNKNVFNHEKLYQPNIIILAEMYSRKDKNPLYMFANEDISKEDLDSYYKEFLEKEYSAIYEKAIYTDLINLINVIRADKSMDVTISYYDDNQKKYLENDNYTKSIRKIDVKDIYKNDKSFKYDFVYLQSLDELIHYYMLESSLVYIARYGFNLNEDGSYFNLDNDSLKIFDALNRNNHIGVYEPYNLQVYLSNQNNSSNNTYTNNDDGIPFEDEYEINEGEDI